LGTVNGLTITMVGDLKNGRTVHSLVRLLSLYNIALNFVSPASLAMPESVKAEAIKAGIPVFETTSLASVIGSTDVLYVTRVQQERFTDEAEYRSLKDAYIVNNELLSRAKEHCLVLHPLPSEIPCVTVTVIIIETNAYIFTTGNAELDPEVDFDQRACYFRQMRYGLFVRMALLHLVLT
jgi:carbamoyl-phosphate synthase/aspartate carbamoyltransferase